MFIGAQSNVNETDWVWINGSNLNNPKYPRSDESLCQQMTWPLTYDNGINLRPKDCGSGESYYVCKGTVNSVIFTAHFLTSQPYVKRFADIG